jgi:hypothetical protein
MCAAYIIDGVRYETLGQLKAALPVSIPIHEGYKRLPKDSCLCPVDCKKLALALGKTVHDDGVDKEFK